MTCEIKNEKCPFQIQCLFPTAADDTRPFALYFYSSQGIQERVRYCAYNGNYKCNGDKSFKETHNGFNNVTITVPDTFARKEGFFDCQKGDISRIKTCSYNPHPPEICDDIRSTKSGIGLETTTKGNSPAIPIAAIVAPVVIVLIIIIIIISCLLYRKYRSKSREPSKTRTIYIDVSSDVPIEECEKSSLGKENTGNHVERSPINSAPDSLMKVIMGLNNPGNRDNALTVNEQAAKVRQGHPSTGNRTSGAPSEIQPTLSSSGSRTPSPGSDRSDKPLLSS